MLCIVFNSIALIKTIIVIIIFYLSFNFATSLYARRYRHSRLAISVSTVSETRILQ